MKSKTKILTSFVMLALVLNASIAIPENAFAQVGPGIGAAIRNAELKARKNVDDAYTALKACQDKNCPGPFPNGGFVDCTKKFCAKELDAYNEAWDTWWAL